MKAADIMTTQVLTTHSDATIAEAIRLMLQHRISGLPVVDKSGSLVGMVTEGDFLRRTEVGTERHRPRWLQFVLGPHRLADEYVHTHGRKVGDVMTKEVVSAEPDMPVDEIVRLMERRRIKRVPIVRGGKLLGIVSRANLLHALGSVAAKTPKGVASDTEIRTKILAEINKESWAPRAEVTVVVYDGIVNYWGTILDEKQREALRVLAENTPGVSEVRDHLVYVEPIPAIIN